jgi:hypothetical protein
MDQSPQQIAGRLILAIGLGLIVLEVASIATGRYFDWNLKRGANNLANAGKYIGLYPGQQAPGTVPTSAVATAPTVTVMSQSARENPSTSTGQTITFPGVYGA